MGKLIDAVRKLGNKLTGKQTVESNSLVKVINDIADDYEGGGGASYEAGDNITIENNVISATDTKYTADKGIRIDENHIIYNTFGDVAVTIPYSGTTIHKLILGDFVDLEVLDFLAPNIGVSELPSAESTESYIILHPYSNVTNESEDEYTLTWVSEVCDGKYYKMTVVLSDPVPNEVPCTIETVNVASGDGTDYGLEFQPTTKVLKPFVEYWLNLQSSGTEPIDIVRLDTAKLKQALVNANYDLDVAITIPQQQGHYSTVLDLTFTLNIPEYNTNLNSDYIALYNEHMYFIVSNINGSDKVIEISNDDSQGISDNMIESITSFSGSTLEDLLDYMITNNINLKLAYSDDFYGSIGWLSNILSKSSDGSLSWYAASTFSNIAVFDYNNPYNPDIYYIDSTDIEDALIYEYHGE